jgi:hypothetical protein
MNEQQLAAVKLALEALECIPTSGSMLGTYAEQKRIEAITTLQSIISQAALDKKADNARELGLSYDDAPKIGCVNHDCDQCKAVQEMTNIQRHEQNVQKFLSTPPTAQPDYAWPAIADYEKEVGFEVNDAFKAAWTMARTTNDLFKQMGESA